MADKNVTPEVEADDTVSAPEEPYESESARYLRVRAEAKAQAAEDMAAEAKAAQEAKAKRLKSSVDKDAEKFRKDALRVEKQINAKKED